MRDVFRKINELIEKGERFAVATIIKTEGSTPRNVGAKMIVMPDGTTYGTIGGGHCETTAIVDAVEAISEGKPRIVSFTLTEQGGSGMICGGNMDVLVEPILPPPVMLLVGAGHLGRALAVLAHMTGFSVTVIDPQASRESFPNADLVITDKFEEGLSKVKVTPETYAVIATRHHETDEYALSQLLQFEAAYIGMVGSRTKVGKIMTNLAEKGTLKDKLRQVHSPIGLAIGAETPEEIAISVMAEVISKRRGGTGKPLSIKQQ